MSKTPAYNPYLPSWEYVPDGEPYVFGDRIYVYGSHDFYNGYVFCMGDYVCWSAPLNDLGNWRYEGVIYPRNADPINKEGKMCLYAPDVTVGPDGRYYLYYVLDKISIVSVAVCDTPAGKYEFYGYVHYPDGTRLGDRAGDEPQFDPGVITEGGTTYLYTGFCGRGDKSRTGSKVVALEADMLTVKSDPVLVVPGIVPESIAFITENVPEGRILEYGLDPEGACRRIRESDLLFCLDCNSYSRTTPEMEGLLRASSAKKVLIDHHLNPETESYSLVFSETEISSTCELLYTILKRMPDIGGKVENLPMTSLNALMAGMTTDTNNFANSVWPGTLEMASELLAAGVDRDAILCNLYNSYRENRLRLMAHLVGEKMKITPQGAAYMILDKETQERFDFQEGESEGFVNIPLSIKDVVMSIFLTAEEDRFRVSLRSKRGISANRFAMEYFNGGGHEMAAGGKLPYGTGMTSPEDAEAYILKVSGLFLKK